MNSPINNWIRTLEAEWSKPNGFLGKAREGVYDAPQGLRFAESLQAMKLPSGVDVDRRFVSLVWYIPLFLSWQRDRVQKHGGDAVAFERLSNQILAIVEEILGIP